MREQAYTSHLVTMRCECCLRSRGEGARLNWRFHSSLPSRFLIRLCHRHQVGGARSLRVSSLLHRGIFYHLGLRDVASARCYATDNASPTVVSDRSSSTLRPVHVLRAAHAHLTHPA